MSASIANHIAEVRRRIPDLGRKVAKIVMEFSMGYCAPDVYRMLATEGSPHFVPGAELLHLTPAPERMSTHFGRHESKTSLLVLLGKRAINLLVIPLFADDAYKGNGDAGRRRGGRLQNWNE